MASTCRQRSSSCTLDPEVTSETLDIIRDSQLMTRVVVGQLYSIYDPIGVICPIIIKNKIELRELHRIKELGWDTCLPEPAEQK